MGEWQDDETFQLDSRDNCNYWCIAHFWVVPAKAEGTWRTSMGELTLTQQFQMVSGTLRNTSGATVNVNGRLRGDQITLTAGTTTYTGKVNGNAMEGAGSNGWSGSKIR